MAKREHKGHVMTPVQQMSTMTESVKKELAALRIGETFSINHPEVLNVYTEKPTNNRILLMQYRERGVQLKGQEGEEDYEQNALREPLPAEVRARLEAVGKLPRTKYSEPKTSNQEIGWYNDLHEPQPLFSFKRGSCKETDYANKYFTMKKLSPFSNKIK